MQADSVLCFIRYSTKVYVEADLALKQQQAEDGSRLDPKPFFTHRTCSYSSLWFECEAEFFVYGFRIASRFG